MKVLKSKQNGSVEYSVTIIFHTGKEIDITPHLDYFEIIEDITNFGLTGSFDFTDVMGIKEFGPLVGGEKIKVLFRTDETFDFVSHDFIISKIARESQVGNNLPRKSLKIYFVSELIYNNVNRVFSKSYNHKTVSQIVEDIYTNLLNGTKDKNFESTKNTISYIIPFWTPQKTIQYLMKSALSSSNDDGGFVFFETLKKVNFISLMKIYKQDPVFDFYFHKHVKTDGERYTGYLGIPNYYENIHTIDILKETESGVYGSTIYVFDHALGQFVKYSLNHKNTEKQNNMGQIIPIYEGYEAKESKVEFYCDYINDRLGNGVEYQKSIDEQVKLELRNRVLYGALNKNAYVIGVYGNSDLSCGSMITADFKSQDENDMLNDKMTGRYLLKAIKHKITIEAGYSQVLLFTKPFYSADEMGVMEKV